MRNILIQEDLKLVEERLKQFETSTGCELLIVVTNASDPYPGASWRFGLVAAFLISITFSYYFELNHPWLWPVGFFLISVLMTALGRFPWAKRLALSSWEVHRECREKAIEYFHTLGTSKVSHKVTVMIMISTLEKNIQLLIDEKLKSEITQSELDELINLMKTHFRSGNVGLGLIHSIERLEKKILKDFGGKVTEIPPSELSDTIHFMIN
jgi:uncharacterized membrane protein